MTDYPYAEVVDGGAVEGYDLIVAAGKLAIINITTGERYANVVEANARDGWFQRVVTDANGRPVIRNGRIAHEVVYAPIRITDSPDG